MSNFDKFVVELGDNGESVFNCVNGRLHCGSDVQIGKLVEHMRAHGHFGIAESSHVKSRHMPMEWSGFFVKRDNGRYVFLDESKQKKMVTKIWASKKLKYTIPISKDKYGICLDGDFSGDEIYGVVFQNVRAKRTCIAKSDAESYNQQNQWALDLINGHRDPSLSGNEKYREVLNAAPEISQYASIRVLALNPESESPFKNLIFNTSYPLRQLKQ